MSLNRQSSAVRVDEPFGSRGGPFGIRWLGVVDDPLVVQPDADAFSLDTKADGEPLRFIDRRSGEVLNRVEASGFTLLFLCAVKLNFVALVEILCATQLAVGVKENARIRIRLGPRFGFEFKVHEDILFIVSSDEAQLRHADFAVDFQDAVLDGVGLRTRVGIPAG